jgi:hypothetical protein
VPWIGRHRGVSLMGVIASVFMVMKRKIPCIAVLVTYSGIKKMRRYHLVKTRQLNLFPWFSGGLYCTQLKRERTSRRYRADCPHGAQEIA